MVETVSLITLMVNVAFYVMCLVAIKSLDDKLKCLRMKLTRLLGQHREHAADQDTSSAKTEEERNEDHLDSLVEEIFVSRKKQYRKCYQL